MLTEKQLEPIRPGIYGDISSEAYHNGPGISSSMLKCMASKTPAHVWANYVDPKRDTSDTDALRVGGAAHKLLFEPESFEQEYAVLDEGEALRKKDIEASDKTLLRYNEWVLMRDMRDALMARPFTAKLLQGGAAEMSGYWIDEQTGALCKYRPDYRTDLYIVDYKTTEDCSPEAFRRSIARYGYHQSAAWYLDGDRALHGTDHDNFIFICQEKKPPHLSNTYLLVTEAIDVGRLKNRPALNDIVQCQQSGDWPGFTDARIEPISVPSWELKTLDFE